MNLSTLDGKFAVCRLNADAAEPGWIDRKQFWTVTRTTEELSIVCAERGVPSEVKAERGWRVIKVEGPLDFGLTGIL